MDEDHEYFKKDYFKPKKLVDQAEEVQGPGLIPNNDGFFDSLPLSKNLHKKQKLLLGGQSKVERER